MSELNNCDMKDWTRELTLPDYSSEVMFYGGTSGGGKAYANEMYEEFLKKHGDAWEKRNCLTIIFDEMSDYYEIKPKESLTYSDSTPRIEPSKLLMKPSNLITNLIGRI